MGIAHVAMGPECPHPICAPPQDLLGRLGGAPESRRVILRRINRYIPLSTYGRKAHRRRRAGPRRGMSYAPSAQSVWPSLYEISPPSGFGGGGRMGGSMQIKIPPLAYLPFRRAIPAYYPLRRDVCPRRVGQSCRPAPSLWPRGGARTSRRPRSSAVAGFMGRSIVSISADCAQRGVADRSRS